MLLYCFPSHIHPYQSITNNIKMELFTFPHIKYDALELNFHLTKTSNLNQPYKKRHSQCPSPPEKPQINIGMLSLLPSSLLSLPSATFLAGVGRAQTLVPADGTAGSCLHAPPLLLQHAPPSCGSHTFFVTYFTCLLDLCTSITKF